MGLLGVDVVKFGGKTARVGEPPKDGEGSSLKKVKDIGTAIWEEGRKSFFFVSALDGITDQLDVLCRSLLTGEISTKKQIEEYVITNIFKPHKDLAEDLRLNSSEIDGLLTLHLNGLLHYAKHILDFRTQLNFSDSTLGVYSPAIFAEAVFKLYFGTGTKSELEDRLEDLSYVNQMRRCVDDIITRGERIMAPIYADYLRSSANNLKAKYIPAEDIFVTDNNHGNATIDVERSVKKARKNLLSLIKDGSYNVFIVPGFYGMNDEGGICCVGRGGSDYSAVAGAYVLSRLKGLYVSDPILTKDTNGILDCIGRDIYIGDSGKPTPNLGLGPNFQWIKETDISTIEHLNYHAASEISAVYAAAVNFVQRYGMNIVIRNVNDYFGSQQSIIGRGKTSENAKLIAGTKDAIMLELQGAFRDIPGEISLLTMPLWGYGVNIGKLFHYVENTVTLLNKGLEFLEQAVNALEERFGPVKTTIASQVRVTGDISYEDRQQFDDLIKVAGCYNLGPWHEAYETLSATIPNIPPYFEMRLENGSMEAVDYYRAVMSMLFMQYHGRQEDARKLSEVLGGFYNQYKEREQA